MYNYLKSYCLKNIWCNPTVDKQFFIRLVRMTKNDGDLASTKVGLYQIPLPDKVHYYHVYQLGGNYPSQFNLIPNELNKWYRIDEYINYTKTFIQFYTSSGLIVARFLSYVRITTNGTILIAIQPQPTIIDLNHENIGIRFYTNAYYKQEESHNIVDYLSIHGSKAINNSSFLDLQSKFYNYRGMPGHAYLLHNGQYVTDIPPNIVKKNDILELIYDSSIDLIYDFSMRNAYSFLSKLDNIRKYLIHPLKSFGKRINYWDDTTFILGKKDKDGIFRGRHITNWDGKRIRMVTHNDYSIAVNVLVSLLESRDDWNGVPLDQYTIRILFRKSGAKRSLVDVHERILELYKLNDDMIIKIMTGQIAGPDEWKVDNLECGNYTKMMKSLYDSITPDLVLNTLGYNAMSKVTADNPKLVTMSSNNNYVELDYMTSTNSTIYGYDKNGLLIAVYDHLTGNQFYPNNKKVTMIEPITSIRDKKPEYYLNKDNVYLNKISGYRYYIRSKTKQTEWEDVTGKSNYYIIENGFLKWNIKLSIYDTLILGDYIHIYDEFEAKPHNDVFEFDILIDENRNVLPVPMGRVEVWLNGHALVQHVDYNVIWPHVVITNVEYMKPTPPQKIQYRVIGFCNSDLSMIDITQYGFIKHGYISLNNRYDVRDNKVVQIIVGGKVVDRSQVFSDEEGGDHIVGDNGVLIPVNNPNISDGQPYQITDVDVNLRYLIDYKTDILKSRSLDLDHRISDFMTRWRPEIILTEPITVESWYRVYSPFIGKILFDINNGLLKIPDRELSETEITNIIKPYEYLLKYEVCNQNFPIDYVVVYTHGSTTMKSVTARTYAFLNLLNKKYLKSCINLNRCLTITK